MATPVPFTRNYYDRSNDSGFQWVFHCDRCSTEYASSYKQNMLSRGRGVLRSVNDLFGGALGRVTSAAEDFSYNYGGDASATKDKARESAVAEIRQQFTQCRPCGEWVCIPVCWNAEVGVCHRCSPAVADEIALAQANARHQQIRDAAHQQNFMAGVDVSTPVQTRCPSCDAYTGGGKFCTGCGAALGGAAAGFCGNCGAPKAPGAVFCANCGQAH